MNRWFAGAPVRLALAALIGIAAGAWGMPGSSAGAAQVDVSFERAPVHEVLRILAEAEGINLIVDQDVVGEVSMSARGLSAMQAIQLVAGLRGLHLEQVGNTLVVSGRPTELAARLAATERAQLKFTQRPVGEVLEALAERAGWNLISEARLDREVTAWLDGMDYVEALRLVAASAGLRYQLTGGVLHIRGTVSAESDERIAIHRLDHVEVQRAKELIEVFVPGARVEIDDTTRSVIVKGANETLNEVAAFLRDFDTARPQVLVEARILEVAVDALDALGVEWSELVAFSGSGTPAAFELTWNPAQLQATLRALAERGRSKVLASPKISAVDQQSARMLIGDRVPIVTEQTDSEGRVTQTVEFIDVGIVLEIEPRIASDGSALLDIRTEVSSVVDPTSRFPTVRTREATTRVRVHDGRPVIIGGLIQEEESRALRGVPFLSELPIVGSLFGRSVEEVSQTETVIILLPHIVLDDGADGTTSDGGAPNAAKSEGVQMALGELEDPVLSRLEHVESRFSVSLDLLPLADGATEVQFERERGRSGFITRTYAALGPDRGAWSLGAAYRLYYGKEEAPPSMRPWVDGGIEIAAPAGDERFTLYTAGAGLKLSLGEHGIFELYARHQEPSRQDALAGLPGRTSRNVIGVKLGWRY